jgi:membrane peptidoglycan carboxypeptidase
VPVELARLRWGSASDGPQERQLLSGCHRIGRDPAAEIHFNDGAVSQRHGLLERVGHSWLLQDQHSTNGLWWRGRRIQALLLRSGDRVLLAPADRQRAPWLQLALQRPAARRVLDLLARAGSALLAAAAVAGLGVLGLGALQLPIRNQLSSQRGPLLLYDRQNRPIRAAESSQHRDLASLSAYPPVLVDALLASEDSRFWWHPGVDPIGTGRALVTNLVGGRVLEGGSTLTQQLARSLHPELVGQGETLGRKWRELLVALQLEARFSKGELLLSYLNRVYLGVGWGFEDASRHYFAKPAARLQLEEAALLVGLLPSPNGYNPCSDPTAALEARNRVLLKMVDAGKLSAEAARRARRQPVALAPGACAAGATVSQQPAPYYTDQVRRDLAALLGEEVAAEGNFLVSTHFDPLLQQVAQRRLQRLLAQSGRGVSQGAVVVLDSRTGGLLAIVGGRDYNSSQYNRASMALRQPGSTFKLFTYLAALEAGTSPGALVSCSPVDWGGQTFRGGCAGRLSLRQAFAGSSNTAALRLARRVGLESVVAKARDLGITTPLEPVPGLVLGQAEVRLLELTAAYGAVANGGIWHAPSSVRLLTDAETRRGAGSGRAALNPGRRVMSPATARQMQGLLQAVVRGGTGGAASLGGEEGGKTGTTNQGRDLLFVGYEPRRHWVIGIWLGNDDNRPTGSSSSLAAGLWADIIRAAGQGSLERNARDERPL